MIELQIRVNTLETVVYSNHEVYSNISSSIIKGSSFISETQSDIIQPAGEEKWTGKHLSSVSIEKLQQAES